MTNGIDKGELRRLVREVLKQALRGEADSGLPPPANLIERMRKAVLPGGSGMVEFTGDLTHFARDIVHAAAHEDLKAAIMAGRLTFTTRQEAQPPSPPRPEKGQGSFRLNDGMLNEMRVEEIGRQYGKIVLGPSVVVTPLARDRARELKLELVRTKS